MWWGDDWAQAFLTTGSDAEDSRLELSVYWAYWAKLLGVLVVSEVTAPEKVATVADDAMRCADQLRPPSWGFALARGLRIATRPRPPESQVIGKLIAPSGMLPSNDKCDQKICPQVR